MPAALLLVGATACATQSAGARRGATRPTGSLVPGNARAAEITDFPVTPDLPYPEYRLTLPSGFLLRMLADIINAQPADLGLPARPTSSYLATHSLCEKISAFDSVTFVRANGTRVRVGYNYGCGIAGVRVPQGTPAAIDWGGGFVSSSGSGTWVILYDDDYDVQSALDLIVAVFCTRHRCQHAQRA